MIEKKLIHKELRRLGRACDMLWLTIGESVIIETHRGGTREVGEYAIHFQCQWRFVKDHEILLASHDIYNPYDKRLEYDDDWDWDVFGREKELSSIFDVRSKELMQGLFPLKIEHIYLSSTSDLHIDFDKGVYFDTFITTSTKREFYRFLDFHTGEHTLIFDVE